LQIWTATRAESPIVVKLGRLSGEILAMPIDGPGPYPFEFEAIDDVDALTSLIFTLDVRQAKATVEADRTRILGLVEEHGGVKELNSWVGTAVYNSWRVMRIPAVRDAVYGRTPNLDAEFSGGDPGGTLLHELTHAGFREACTRLLGALEAREVEAETDGGGSGIIDVQTKVGNTALMFGEYLLECL